MNPWSILCDRAYLLPLKFATLAEFALLHGLPIWLGSDVKRSLSFHAVGHTAVTEKDLEHAPSAFTCTFTILYPRQDLYEREREREKKREKAGLIDSDRSRALQLLLESAHLANFIALGMCVGRHKKIESLQRDGEAGGISSPSAQLKKGTYTCCMKVSCTDLSKAGQAHERPSPNQIFNCLDPSKS